MSDEEFEDFFGMKQKPGEDWLAKQLDCPILIKDCQQIAFNNLYTKIAPKNS